MTSKSILTLVVVSLATLDHPVRADLSVSESFDYSPATLLEGQTGGTGFGGRAWQEFNEDTVAVRNSGLTHPSLQSSGSAGSTNGYGGGTLAWREFDTIPGADGTATWLSFLLRRESPIMERGTDSDLFLFLLQPDFRDEVYSPGFSVLPNSDGMASFSMTASQPFDPLGNPVEYFPEDKPFFLGTTYLIVARVLWDFAGPESITMFVNPDLNGGPPALGDGLTRSDMEMIDPRSSVHQLQKFTLLTDQDPIWIIDEIRIGSDFASVTPVPEPGVLALLGAGAGLFIARRRPIG